VNAPHSREGALYCCPLEVGCLPRGSRPWISLLAKDLGSLFNLFANLVKTFPRRVFLLDSPVRRKKPPGYVSLVQSLLNPLSTAREFRLRVRVLGGGKDKVELMTTILRARCLIRGECSTLRSECFARGVALRHFDGAQYRQAQDDKSPFGGFRGKM